MKSSKASEIAALAHSQLCIIYEMLKNKTAFAALGSPIKAGPRISCVPAARFMRASEFRKAKKKYEKPLGNSFERFRN
jgi:hypothetical protein